MPRYSFQIDGQRHVFEGPDPQTTARYAQQWANAQRAGAPVTLGGTARSFGSGIVRGLAGISDSIPISTNGLGAAIDNAARFGAWAGKGLGVSPRAANAFVQGETNLRRGTPFETAGELGERSRLLHNPQNSVERFANTAGEFVPNAFLPGGAERSLLRAGGQAALRVLAPATGATVAPAIVRMAGGNQDAQNLARVAGAVAGSGLAGASGAIRRTPQAADAIVPEVAPVAPPEPVAQPQGADIISFRRGPDARTPTAPIPTAGAAPEGATPDGASAGAGAPTNIVAFGSRARPASQTQSPPVTLSGPAGLNHLKVVGDAAPEPTGKMTLQSFLSDPRGSWQSLRDNAVEAITSPEAKSLMAQGFPLTPGQRVGGIGRAIENVAGATGASIGGPIRAAQARGIEAFNRAVANRALAHIDESLPADVPVGQPMIDYIEGKLSADRELADSIRLRPSHDGDFIRELNGVNNLAEENLPARQYNVFQNNVNSTQNMINSMGLKESGYPLFASHLHDLADKFGSSSDARQQMMGRYFDELGGAIDRFVERSNAAADQVGGNANAGYARFVRMRDAAMSPDSPGGVFSPATLKAVVSAPDRDFANGGSAEADAELHRLASDAHAVMGSTPASQAALNRGGAVTGAAASGLMKSYQSLGNDVATTFENTEPLATLNFARQANAFRTPQPSGQPVLTLAPSPNRTSPDESAP